MRCPNRIALVGCSILSLAATAALARPAHQDRMGQDKMAQDKDKMAGDKMGGDTMAKDVVTYEVTITNLTQGQPFSPPVIVTHAAGMHLWQEGEKASNDLRALAEEGMNKDLVKMCQGKATDIAAAPATMEGHIMPGKSMTMKIKAKPGDVLSAAFMLAATNDGFSGLDSVALGEGGMMMSKETMAYDAGTEENSEKKTDTAAPDMGKGHPATNPPQPIGMHKGIMGTGDLDKDKMGWSGPVAKIEIKKVEQ